MAKIQANACRTAASSPRRTPSAARAEPLLRKPEIRGLTMTLARVELSLAGWLRGEALLDFP
jgi:hypothetical protein